MDARLASEVEFHNRAYSEDLRHCTSKYYLSIQASIDFYRNYLAANSRGKDVLEYGCGENSYAALLSQWGARLTAIDISDVAIDHCRAHAAEKKLANARFEVMNAEELKFPDSSFDLICGVAILHHLEFHKAFSEIARVLRPGGTAIFREPLAHNPVINLYRRFTPRLRTPDEHPFYMRELKLLEQYFGQVDKTYFHLFSIAATPLLRFPGGRALLKLLSGLDGVLFRAVPPLRRYAWSVALVVSRPVKAAAAAGGR